MPPRPEKQVITWKDVEVAAKRALKKIKGLQAEAVELRARNQALEEENQTLRDAIEIVSG